MLVADTPEKDTKRAGKAGGINEIKKQLDFFAFKLNEERSVSIPKSIVERLIHA